MAEPFTIYKLTVLFMLSKSNVPMSNSQITDFFLDRQYTNYFNVQEAIEQLCADALIHSMTNNNTTTYRITDTGRHTLQYLSSKLSTGIQDDVNRYFENQKWDFRQKYRTSADYYREGESGYRVTCQVCQEEKIILSMEMLVFSEEQAKSICLNWKGKYEDIHAFLLETLIQ